jgi:hypothetical protein
MRIAAPHPQRCARRGVGVVARTRTTKPKRPAVSTGLPAMGAGYGGEARGYSRPAITDADQAAALSALGRDPAHRAAREALRAEALAVQVRVMREGEHEHVRVMAADKVLDRLGGRPTVGAPGEGGEQVTQVTFGWAKENNDGG